MTDNLHGPPMSKAPSARHIAERDLLGELLADIRQQFERRQRDYAEAGGDPHDMQGSLTCYLEYRLLHQIFEPPQ